MSRRWKWAAGAVLTGALVVPVSLVPAGTAYAAGGWTPVGVPATGNNVSLNGVSARTATDAWAVGQQFAAAGQAPPPPVTYHWNGTAWSLVSTPALGVNSALLAVSASSATDAWAVGFEVLRPRQRQTLLEHWNGTAWSVDAADSVSGSAVQLSAVTDLSASNAYAVGIGAAGPLLEHWNGTSWSPVTLPDPAFNVGPGQAISASSASDIWVVGTTSAPATGQAVAEAIHFNGSAWAVVPMAQPGANTPAIAAVTAIAAGNAWAVGEDIGATSAVGGSTLTEHWNGSSWSIVPSPTPGADPGLTGVAARSASDVYAVGTGLPSVNGGPEQALILRWNGTSWADDTGGTISGSLAAAATFPGSAREWAVGFSGGQGLALSHG
ncbi:MAG: hypothetical protein ABSB59_16995 [Streptosporangiaceae bacterium]|jgi:hypothetical protein